MCVTCTWCSVFVSNRVLWDCLCGPLGNVLDCVSALYAFSEDVDVSQALCLEAMRLP